MIIPEHKIDEVLERTDLLALVSRHVELKKSGRSYKGCCPFHQEKTASFYVTPEMRRFKCFGCQAGGDAISFLQRILGKTFLDAVSELAKEAGVDLSAGQDPAQKERAQIKEATDLAQQHFRASFLDPHKGRTAREYLRSRGVDPAQWEAFGLGFAPEGWQELTDKLLSAGILEFGAKAGLVSPRPKGDGYYDLFRARLMVPIRSPEGRTLGFGGRLLSGEGPKYLNSRDSRLYNKSDILFGVDQAKDAIRQSKSAVLVEGYFDCIGLHQVGLKEALALCSTALTSGHLKLLERLGAKSLTLLLDGDDAGRNAVERLAGILLAQGFSTRVAQLPQGEDPDTHARRVGAEGMRALLSSAPPLTQHLFSTLAPQGPASSFEAKMAAIERLKPLCSQLAVGLTRSAFLSSLGHHLGLPPAELELSLRGREAAPVKPVPKVGAGPTREAPDPRSTVRPPGASAGRFSGSPPPAGRAAQVPAVPPPAPAAPPARRPERAPDPLEAWVSAALLIRPGLREQDALKVAEDLRHSGLRVIVTALFSGRAVEDALEEASPLTKAALERARQELPRQADELEGAFVLACRKLCLRRIDEQLSHIARAAAQVAGQGELSEELKTLQAERIQLLEQKRSVLETGSSPSAESRKKLAL